jgi:hypothetical protein
MPVQLLAERERGAKLQSKLQELQPGSEQPVSSL